MKTATKNFENGQKIEYFSTHMRKAIILLSMLTSGLHSKADVKFLNFNKLDSGGKLAVR